MKTPICDFLNQYDEGGFARFHMPGHKGQGGIEKHDITEVFGADNLFCATGIIKESEDIAAELFGTEHTYYSTEGSTLAIKAALALVSFGKRGGKILAGRNAHKSFLYGAALLDLDVSWIEDKGGHICSSDISPSDVERALTEESGALAVYITSPDYLGNILDVRAIADACHKRGVPLIVDNAHGAYLAFLSKTAHPIALGADICCDSAHKTLPVLTGGAYLHISKRAKKEYTENARRALSLFASTSPSYLILESLDRCNGYIADGYRQSLCDFVVKTDRVKSEISALGLEVMNTEPCKIVIRPASYGYTGEELAQYLREARIEPEYSDRFYTVLMLTPNITDENLERLSSSLSRLERKEPRQDKEPSLPKSRQRVMSIREAMLLESQRVPTEMSAGRICAEPTVACPPAVPVLISGERILAGDIAVLKAYGINEISVVKE